MDKQQVNSRIATIFETEFEVAPDRLLPDAHLFQDLGLDSIDVVEMIAALQKEFGIQLRDSEEARAIRTLGNLQDFVFAEIEKSQAGDGPAPQP
ncbi:MAG: phosphopantetheine-binding protein [Terrimicrobiaceae bacterium]